MSNDFKETKVKIEKWRTKIEEEILCSSCNQIVSKATESVIDWSKKFPFICAFRFISLFLHGLEMSAKKKVRPLNGSLMARWKRIVSNIHIRLKSEANRQSKNDHMKHSLTLAAVHTMTFTLLHVSSSIAQTEKKIVFTVSIVNEMKNRSHCDHR